MNPQLVFLVNKSLESLRISNLDAAELFLKQALRLDSKNTHVLRLLGVIFAKRGRYKEAIEFFNSSLKSTPKNPLTLSNLGNVFLVLKDFDKALDLYEKSIRIEPNYAEAWSNKGNVLYELRRYEEALVNHDKAISLNPNYAEAWSNKGNVLYELRRYEEALVNHDKAISLNPNYAEAWSNKGNVLYELRRYEEALVNHDKAISLNPNYAEAWSNKGNVYKALALYEVAIECFEKAIDLNPTYPQSWKNKGISLNFLKKHSEAADCFFRAHKLDDKNSYLLGLAHHQMMLTCNWMDYEKITNQIFDQISRMEGSEDPFGFQGISKSELLNKLCAEIYSKEYYPVLDNLCEGVKYGHKKIRIGYVCGEFREQATSILMIGAWESHDRNKFEIFAFDNGFSDGSDYRRRINQAFKNIINISELSDSDAAKLIKSYEIDILVNLNGFFGLARQAIFSYRPAPVQVNYLGFPGTLGAPYINYIIADKTVIPETSSDFYTEKIAYLPGCYQANDNKRSISARQFSKAELGIPENYFVFACFNNNYKITPATFAVWMRILAALPTSVLWLLADNPQSQDNLIKEAQIRGIDSSRLIFAERMTSADHLARHRLADLFLDTLPYGAHTTCSDALWCGLPVLTQMGNTFPGRVSASLLNSMELHELITYSEGEYEAAAIELASDPIKLSLIKQRLNNNRLATPLFNTSIFTRDLETLFLRMIERHEKNLHVDHLY